jgi:hypothetical protein
VRYCYCGLCSGHCGLVAGKFDELGIGKLLTGLFKQSRMRIATAGHALKTTVPPRLGVINNPSIARESPEYAPVGPSSPAEGGFTLETCGRTQLTRELS